MKADYQRNNVGAFCWDTIRIALHVALLIHVGGFSTRGVLFCLSLW